MQWPRKRSQVVERNSTLKRQNTTENNASKNRSSGIASAGSRTRVNCLEGSYANRYTTDASEENEANVQKFQHLIRRKRVEILTLHHREKNGLQCVYFRAHFDSKFPGVRDTNSSSVVQSSRAEGAVTDFVGYGATKTISP
ncbi:hypothetical protein TNCV_3413391 [Trichonephila clavipes]|uniref:Uncharacterized protein n=1 Tax=Trichonephila clavipes TaxID=2585209 RepID=A0A8X6V3R3_TRICX|nr:hypothetical protein TNCV_3413391 [Trichonephila clavipes]